MEKRDYKINIYNFRKQQKITRKIMKSSDITEIVKEIGLIPTNTTKGSFWNKTTFQNADPILWSNLGDLYNKLELIKRAKNNWITNE